MLKYEALTAHLTRIQQNHYPMSFADLEAVIQDKLPPSAYKHRAWWSNNPSNSVMTKAWLDAGWISSDVDMEKKRLVFRRAKGRTLQPTSPHGSDNPASASRDPGRKKHHIITIGDLGDATMQVLAAKARLAGETVDQVARKILEQGAQLTTADRLALADRVRSRSPQLHDIDVVTLIREDRDAR